MTDSGDFVMDGTENAVEIIGMIGVKRESSAHAGAALSVIGGGADPAKAVPAGIDPDYIVEFSQAHERNGFDKVLIGYASTSADGFMTALHAAAHTESLGYLIAHRAGFMAPTLAARKIATLDQLTVGRIALHVITGGSDEEQKRDGDWVDHDSRYRRTAEYMDVLKKVWTETDPFDYDGEFYQFRGSYSDVRCYQQPHVPLYFGGASESALQVGSARADVYALWGEPVASIKAQIESIRERARQHGRTPRFSISLRPIIGDTEAEAWDRAHEILAGIERSVGSVITPGQSVRPQSVGSRRLIDLSNEGEVLDKRLWTAIARASGAPGSTTALVGTAEQVADSLLDYYEVGCSTILIRGFDPLNDTIEFGKELIPAIRDGAARRRNPVISGDS